VTVVALRYPVKPRSMKPVSISAQVAFENSSTLGTSIEGCVESEHLEVHLKVNAIVQKLSEVVILLM
jgi:hypothetical protein